MAAAVDDKALGALTKQVQSRALAVARALSCAVRAQRPQWNECSSRARLCKVARLSERLDMTEKDVIGIKLDDTMVGHAL